MVEAAGQPVIDNRKGTNGGSRPVPDPTELTDRAIARLEKSLTERFDGELAVRDERLNGIDKATTLRLEQVDQWLGTQPTVIEKEVGAFGHVHDVKFDGIQTQFRERDARADRESQLNKIALDAAFSASKEAVAAAFAAQKEDANRRDEANGKAIDKSEKATAETIKTNQELNKSTTDALTKSLDEVKLAVSRIESNKVGGQEQKQSGISTLGIIATVISIVIGFVTIGGFIIVIAASKGI